MSIDFDIAINKSMLSKLLIFILFMSATVQVALALSEQSNATVGIPDSGIGGPITQEEVKEYLEQKMDHSETRSVLLGPDRNYTDLHRAAESCDLNKLQVAIHEFPFRIRNEEINKMDRNGYSPLVYAARGGCMEMVKYLIKRGAVVDRCEEYGAWTPLFHAAEQGHAEIVEYLLLHGANVNVLSGGGETPLQVATRGPIFHYGPQGDQDATIAILLKHGAKNDL